MFVLFIITVRVHIMFMLLKVFCLSVYMLLYSGNSMGGTTSRLYLVFLEKAGRCHVTSLISYCFQCYSFNRYTFTVICKFFFYTLHKLILIKVTHLFITIK